MRFDLFQKDVSFFNGLQSRKHNLNSEFYKFLDQTWQ